MTSQLRVGDLLAGLGGILLFVSSLLHQFGGTYDAYHRLLLGVLVVTYLLGGAVAAVSIAVSLDRLPARWPWRPWTAALAAVVLANSVIGALSMREIIRTIALDTQRPDPGLGPGAYLGIAAAVILFVGVALRPVVPLLATPLVPSADATAGDPTAADPTAADPTAADPTPARPTGTGSRPPDPQPASPQPASPQPASPQPASSQPASPQPATAPFVPFWTAVPTPRPLYGLDDPRTVVATLHPGSWYAAVGPHSHGLVVQLASGEVGVLVEVADVVRG